MPLKYSGKQIIKAGEALVRDDIDLNGNKFEKAFDVLSYWRFSHEHPLEEAISLLQEVTSKIDRRAIFAKRLKRYISIVAKLKRFPDMKLKNMQDIGGCRAIISNPKKLTKIVRELKKRTEFRNGEGRIKFKDYIENPKDDGYRGYHIIGKFGARADSKRNIELQVRTSLQHDWATTLEIVDLFTGQALKSNQGDKNWKDFFIGVSEQFALMEQIHLFDTFDKDKKNIEYANLLKTSNKHLIESCKTVQNQAKKLNIVRKLDAYAHSLKILDKKIDNESFDGYVLLEVDTINTTLSAELFSKKNNRQAEEKYSSLEKKAAGKEGIVVALVSSTAVGGIKEAYPNYFADSTDFIRHLLFIVNFETRNKWLLRL